MYLIDTNVLLTATDESRPRHREARHLLAEAGHNGLHLAASGQILREYLVVATRPPDVNGLGPGVRDAMNNLGEFLGRMHLYDETEGVSLRLRQLCLDHRLHGKRLHDANVVATMLTHRLRILVTRNAADFSPFDEVEVVDVDEAAAHR